jgi:hypothetical protein
MYGVWIVLLDALPRFPRVATPEILAHVVPRGDNVEAMSCPVCDRLDRDEQLLSEAIEERRETLRYALSEDEREEIAIEEAALAALLQRIIERRAA